MDKKKKSSFSLFNVEWDFPVLTDEERARLQDALAVLVLHSLKNSLKNALESLEEDGLIKL